MFTKLNNLTDSLVDTWMSNNIVVRFCLIFFSQLNLTFQNPVNKISPIILPVDYLIKLVKIFIEKVRHKLAYIEG